MERDDEMRADYMDEMRKAREGRFLQIAAMLVVLLLSGGSAVMIYVGTHLKRSAEMHEEECASRLKSVVESRSSFRKSCSELVAECREALK